jgi:hypothetical protein
MTADRLIRVLRLLTSGNGSGMGGLCAECVKTLAVAGAGVMVLVDELPRGSVCAAGALGSVLEELQFTTGEGPGVDAFGRGRPVAEPDLASLGASRWIAFAGAAIDAGAKAVFGFPILIGAVRVGALSLYHDHPGTLSLVQREDAVVFADVAGRQLLAIQAGAPLGSLAADLEKDAEFRLVVHPAAGMVSAQLEVSVTEALVRLRAFAFAHQRSVLEVAGDVVARRLRFS